MSDWKNIRISSMVGARVRLVPKTLHGKNRVKEHGDTFEVVKVDNMPVFDGKLGMQVKALETKHPDGYSRNVALENDKHFNFELL